MISQKTIEYGLRKAGLKKGDTVLVHSSLRSLGPLEGVDPDDRNGFVSTVFAAFSRILGLPRQGTLVVPTFTHEYARNNIPFMYEKSPSEVGLFTEYVRKQKGAYRSMHPINSFCAIGKKKHDICKDVSISCYGYNSVFDRLYQLDAKMMFFGCGMYHMTLKHHLEQMVALPYVYTKAYFTPVYKNNKPVKLPFLAVVRYLNGRVNNNDCRQFERHLKKKRMLTSVEISKTKILLMRIRDAYDQGYELLQKNPCYFLKKPYYTTK
ncbi:MAG: AAC(3) family N-acetyltransferase [Candidatus Omnitrophica bacterium]|nr:AAC(3) family N-acetyltransferase [Candidatus Omnitrophota bacterium]